MKQKPYANDHDERAWGTDPPMGAGLVRIDLHLHRYPSGYDATIPIAAAEVIP